MAPLYTTCYSCWVCHDTQGSVQNLAKLSAHTFFLSIYSELFLYYSCKLGCFNWKLILIDFVNTFLPVFLQDHTTSLLQVYWALSDNFQTYLSLYSTTFFQTYFKRIHGSSRTSHCNTLPHIYCFTFQYCSTKCILVST